MKRPIEKGCRISSSRTGQVGIVQAITGIILFCDEENTQKKFVVRHDEAVLYYRVFLWYDGKQNLVVIDSTVEHAKKQAEKIAGVRVLDGPCGILETDGTGGAFFKYTD